MPKKKTRNGRDAKGRFLSGPCPDRHELTYCERRAGYDRFCMLVQQGRIPSQISAHIRRKIRCTGKLTGKHRQEEAAVMKQAYKDNGIPF